MDPLVLQQDLTDMMDPLFFHKETAIEVAEQLSYKELSDIMEKKLEAQIAHGKVLARALLDYTKDLTVNGWADVKIFQHLNHVDLAKQIITTVNAEDTDLNYIDQSPVNDKKRKRA